LIPVNSPLPHLAKLEKGRILKVLEGLARRDDRRIKRLAASTRSPQDRAQRAMQAGLRGACRPQTEQEVPMAKFSAQQAKSRVLAQLESVKSRSIKGVSQWPRRGREILHNTQGAVEFIASSLAEESRHLSLAVYAELQPLLQKSFPQRSWPRAQDLNQDASLAPLSATHEPIRRDASVLRDPFQNI